MEHCDALIRNGDGTKLFIRDESADYEVEVDKYFITSREIEVTIFVKGFEKGASSVLSEMSESRYFDRFAGDPAQERFALIFRISREEKTAISQLSEILLKCLESLNNAVDRTYEIYYRQKRIGGEIRRSKYEQRLTHPDATDRQRRYAKAYLLELDKQLEKRITARNTELHERLGKK
jgi:hypothetical protein